MVKKTINVGVHIVEVARSNGMDTGLFGSWTLDESDALRFNGSSVVVVAEALRCARSIDSDTVTRLRGK